MEPWLGPLIVAAVLISASVVSRLRGSKSRTSSVVLRLDIGKDLAVPLTIVNAGRDPVFELEATLRFEGRAPRSGPVMERHRRSLVLLPGERLAFPLPENMEGGEASQFAAHVVRVHLDAVGRDATGRAVEAQDVLEDPMTWMESVRRSQSSLGSGKPLVHHRTDQNEPDRTSSSGGVKDLEHGREDIRADPSPGPSRSTQNTL